MYFRQIRPENIRPENSCSHFFITSSGLSLTSISKDMERLHEIYVPTNIVQIIVSVIALS